MTTNVYSELAEKHRSTDIPELWPWQDEVLTSYAGVDGDAAVELPTGAGKTLIGLLAAEQHRQVHGGRVAYVAGNKQLAQQVERQASELDFPVVRFEGSKDSWDRARVRQYNFGQAIGVMNYWNYFNAAPGVESADMLILDDVHLLEGRLREMFTVAIGRSDPFLEDVLRRIVERCPYYSRVQDLIGGVEITKPAEMLAFPDSADLAGEVGDLLDVRLPEGSEAWWAWQNIREQLAVCCWLVSGSGITFTPYVLPTPTLDHFQTPSRRLYLSATIGTVDDLQRRLGAPPMELLLAAVQPMQGDRLVVIRDDTEALDERGLVAELDPLLKQEKKALWLCARKETAANIHDALQYSGLDGEVRILEGDNAADEPFSEDDAGHLVAAGRYDGMDFPGEACRLEVIPEVPVATSDLEDFVAAFLRDAPFAQVRFGQRVAQALGRCNRQKDDRAAYVLTDPEFLGRFSQQRIVDALPGHVREDVLAAAIRADKGFEAGMAEVASFLKGGSLEQITCPPRGADLALPATASEEVEGVLSLWTGDYDGAAELFDRVAEKLSAFREYRGFWLAMRALALERAAALGDTAAAGMAKQALAAGVAAGGRNVFFTRLGLSAVRREGQGQPAVREGDDDLFSSWDRLVDRFGTAGPRFDRWAGGLLTELQSTDHDTVARGIARVGLDLLGLQAEAPKATSGEEDVYWELSDPRCLLTFEVKLAPKSKTVVNGDVEQAEGAAKAAEAARGVKTKGLLVTPYESVEETALPRLERVRLITVATFVEQVEKLLVVLRGYRRGWEVDAQAREAARDQALAGLPPLDWLWRALSEADDWVTPESLDQAWAGRG